MEIKVALLVTVTPSELLGGIFVCATLISLVLEVPRGRMLPSGYAARILLHF